MRRSVMSFTLLAGFSALALAASWQGRLVDATCYDQQKAAATCDPTSSTTMFVLVASDKAYKLDDVGNSKAATALKSRADRSSDPTKPASGPGSSCSPPITAFAPKVSIPIHKA